MISHLFGFNFFLKHHSGSCCQCRRILFKKDVELTPTSRTHCLSRVHFNQNEQDDICFECIFIWELNKTYPRKKEQQPRPGGIVWRNMKNTWRERFVVAIVRLIFVWFRYILSRYCQKNYSVWNIIHHFRNPHQLFYVCFVISAYHANEFWCEKIIRCVCICCCWSPPKN